MTALEQQVGDLERRVQTSEQDAAAARVLAGGADRDVGEIRAEIREFGELNTRLHNATRADIANMRVEIRGLQTGHTDLRAEVSDLRDQMSTGFIEMRGRLDATAAGQQRIVELLGEIIDQRHD